MDTNQLAKDIGGLAAVATLLAHFLLPSLPLTPGRVQLLLVLIGGLLIGDWIWEQYFHGTSSGQQQDRGNNS